MFKAGDIVRFLYDSEQTAMAIGFRDSKGTDIYSDRNRFVMAMTKEGEVISFLFNDKDWIVVDHVDLTEIIQRIEEAKRA